MTPEHIHDALTLLSADLIAETDKKRSRRTQVIPWKRYAAMAACFVLVLSGSLFALTRMGMGGSTKEAAIEIQMAEEEAPAEAAEPMESDPLCGVPTAPASENSASITQDRSDLCIDHAHHPAEPQEETAAQGGWCGNTTAVLYLEEGTFSISGGDAVALSRILYQLEYDPANLCGCTAQFTADTEMGSGYEISLEEYFVRFEGGQAGLTENQAYTIARILERAEESGKESKGDS